MSSDEFTEVTHEGWGGRIVDSIKGVVVGVVLFLGSFPVLWMNEGCSVRTARSLEEGAANVVSIKADKVSPAHEGKLVHLSDQATTDETLQDPEFGVQARGIKLIRKVEMYQWQETKQSRSRKKLGGGRKTVTTYKYGKKWSDSLVDSGAFRKPEGHANPSSIPYQAKNIVAKAVTLGAYKLPPLLVEQISRSEALALDSAALRKLPAALRSKAKPHGGGFYVGSNPLVPAVGDLRITFKVVKPQTISIIARQVGDTFEAYKAKAGNSIAMVSAGTVSADNMFKAALERNTMFTWLLRLGGFLMMALGIGLVFAPLSTIADVVPFFGDLLGMGIALFALAVAAGISLVVIAVAWIFYRPLLGVLLLAGGAAIIVGIKFCARGRKKG